MSEWIRVYKDDLEEIHDTAEDLWLSLERKTLYDESEKARWIKDTIESTRFYKEEAEQ